MTADAEAIRFVHAIRQMSDAEGQAAPIRAWRPPRGDAGVVSAPSGPIAVRECAAFLQALLSAS